jgi:hypothetical protein
MVECYDEKYDKTFASRNFWLQFENIKNMMVLI